MAMEFMSNLNCDRIKLLPGNTPVEKIDNAISVLMQEPSIDFLTKAKIGSFWPIIKGTIPEDPAQAEAKFIEGCRMFAALFGLDVEFTKQ